MPYRYLLVVLTRFFAHHPDPVARNRIRLRRWFWRAALLGPEIFKGSTTGAMRHLCAKVRPYDETSSVDALLEAADDKPRYLPTVTRFKANEANSKVILCSWWELGPQSPVSGRPYDNTDLSEYQIDRPTAAEAARYLVRRQAVRTEIRNSGALRTLLPDDALDDELGSYFSQPSLELQNGAWDDMLTSHGLTAATAQVLAEGNHEAFVQLRAEWLSEHLQTFLARQCEWDLEDTPPLADLNMDDTDAPDDDAA